VTELRRFPLLTPAQWLVLERLVRGESNEAIGRALGLGVPTVKTHLTGIYQRLPLGRAANKRAAAVAWYRREGHRHHEGAG
jgi:DNA-binding NarL/FixJ family response regulator